MKQTAGWRAWMLTGLILILGIGRGLGVPVVRAQESPSLASALSEAATGELPDATVEAPAAVWTLLDAYAASFQASDEGAFASCFWDPSAYLASFRSVVSDWFDVRVRFREVRFYGKTGEDRLTLKAKIESRLRERRTRRLVPLDTSAEFLLEKRQGEWRLVSIQAGPRTREGKE